MLAKKRLLAILAQGDTFAKIEPMFGRAPLEVHRASDGATGLILSRNISYELVISEFPVPGTGENIIESLRAPTSPCLGAPLLLLGEADALAYVARHPDLATYVMSSKSDSAEVQQKISSLLGISVRLTSRLLVQIMVEVSDSKVLRACQTRDISANGMLLRTGQQLPVGSEVAATFYLPGDTSPLESKIRVVRHTDPIRELPGMGVQFTWLSAEDQERLQDFLTGLLVNENELEPNTLNDPRHRGGVGRIAGLAG